MGFAYCEFNKTLRKEPVTIWYFARQLKNYKNQFDE